MTGKPSRGMVWLTWVLISACILLVVGAHLHLAYVAFQSQPACVEHVKAVGDGQGYRAAKSAC